jgi:hypothetical protein
MTNLMTLKTTSVMLRLRRTTHAILAPPTSRKPRHQTRPLRHPATSHRAKCSYIVPKPFSTAKGTTDTHKAHTAKQPTKVYLV